MSDTVNQASVYKQIRVHRGFLRDRALAQRQRRKHRQTRTTNEILEARRGGRTASAEVADAPWGSIGSRRGN